MRNPRADDRRVCATRPKRHRSHCSGRCRREQPVRRHGACYSCARVQRGQARLTRAAKDSACCGAGSLTLRGERPVWLLTATVHSCPSARGGKGGWHCPLLSVGVRLSLVVFGFFGFFVAKMAKAWYKARFDLVTGPTAHIEYSIPAVSNSSAAPNAAHPSWTPGAPRSSKRAALCPVNLLEAKRSGHKVAGVPPPPATPGGGASTPAAAAFFFVRTGAHALALRAEER